MPAAADRALSGGDRLRAAPGPEGAGGAGRSRPVSPQTASPEEGYPAELECDVLLSDGRAAHLRPIRPEDAPALRSLGERLSPETVYFRFFAPRHHIGDEEIAHYATVDYHDRLALIAVVDGELVAVARYDRCGVKAPGPGEPGTAAPNDGETGPVLDEAEVAFVVRDDHQGRGIGTVLLEHLASAAVQRGIGRFVADTLPENYRMLNVFRSAGFDEHARLDSGVIGVSLELASRPEYLELVEEREWTAAVRSINRILRPTSVLVAGEGPSLGTVGRAIVHNLLAGGFTGAVYAVDGEGSQTAGLSCYPSVSEVPGPVDLAVIAGSGGSGEVVRACGAKGAGGIVIVSSGRSDRGSDSLSGHDLVHTARLFGMRLVGPECMGLINTRPEIRMNASVAEHSPPRGRVAFAAQSGGLGIALLGELSGPRSRGVEFRLPR